MCGVYSNTDKHGLHITITPKMPLFETLILNRHTDSHTHISNSYTNFYVYLTHNVYLYEMWKFAHIVVHLNRKY